MKQAAETILLVVMILAGAGMLVAPTYLDRTQSTHGANPAFVTSCASPEKYEAERNRVEKFGRFQVVLPSFHLPELELSSEDFGENRPEASSANYRALNIDLLDSGFLGQVAANSDRQEVTAITLDLAPCLPGQAVSGGKLVVTQNGRDWELEFYQLGAEAVVYTNRLPADWVYELGIPFERAEISGELLQLLEKIYESAGENKRKVCSANAQRLAKILIGVVCNEFQLNPDS